MLTVFDIIASSTQSASSAQPSSEAVSLPCE
jgi:hypothetical protein